MAVTSLWSIKGWLGSVTMYVEDPAKTTNPEAVNLENAQQRREQYGSQDLADVISYAVQQEKTERPQNVKKWKLHDEDAPVMERFVSGVNCSAETAREEMLDTKRLFDKMGGTVAYHGYQSFAPGEATPEMAHEIGVKLARELWGDKYQVIVATHLDHGNHLHNHFVLNTVSFVDGMKFYRSEKDYWDMRKASDRLCRAYSLSVIEETQPQSRAKHYAEHRAEKNGEPTYKMRIKAAVDTALAESMTLNELWDNLRRKGYSIDFGKDISVREPGAERGRSLQRNFGPDYSLEGLKRRLLAQTRSARPAPEARPVYKRAKVRGLYIYIRKSKAALNPLTFTPLRQNSLMRGWRKTGFRALYLRYCYLLGVYPKGRKWKPPRLRYEHREDIRRVHQYSAEVRLLCAHRIDTPEQLLSYREGAAARMAALTGKRKHLWYRTRSLRDEAALAEVKGEISQLSGEISKLRKEVKLCDRISQHSAEIREKLLLPKNPEKEQERQHEKNQYR